MFLMHDGRTIKLHENSRLTADGTSSRLDIAKLWTQSTMAKTRMKLQANLLNPISSIGKMRRLWTTEQSEDSRLSTLTESIQDALSLHSKELIDDIADTLVPAVKRVKQAHGVLNEEDVNLAAGLREFDQGCRQMEDITSLENDQVREVYFDSQARIKELFKRLHEAYMRREQLWSDLQTALDETINPSLESLKALPADLERTIANLEKQSKQMVQKDNGGSEKVLKSLLSKFI
ncbi:hypothetical protein PQX77_015079 [Marasmius sp. AFHP31]|nr:hypothetical protein PQX77_015079 [Marasmius sp. AFHP31]